jgi:hypothetical protein
MEDGERVTRPATIGELCRRLKDLGIPGPSRPGSATMIRYPTAARRPARGAGSRPELARRRERTGSPSASTDSDRKP